MADLETRLLDDLAWREDEIVVLKTAYALEPESSPKGKSLRRAYLAMLYSHYEGFSKFTWEECLIDISRSGFPLQRLRPSLCTAFVKKEINQLRKCESKTYVDDVFAFRIRMMDVIPSDYETFETSNLWPNIFVDVLETFGMRSTFVDKNRLSLKALVGRRNDIAHGKNIGVTDQTLQDLHDAVFDVFVSFTVEAVRYINNKIYLR